LEDERSPDRLGTTTFEWLHGSYGRSFFLQQDMEMDYSGTVIKSREIIGYHPKTNAFYERDIEGDNMMISIKSDPIDATFHGKFSADGNSFSGGWRPNPGADETINAPYDITASRVM
jgi:hypothetical protein